MKKIYRWISLLLSCICLFFCVACNRNKNGDEWETSNAYYDVKISRTYSTPIQGGCVATVFVEIEIKQDFELTLKTPLLDENNAIIGDKTEIVRIIYAPQDWNCNQGSAAAGSVTYTYTKGEKLSYEQQLASWDWKMPTEGALKIDVTLFRPDKTIESFATNIQIQW